MPRTLFQSFALGAFAAGCLTVMTNAATAGSFLRGCAWRDMQVLMLLEERESANAVTAQALTDAVLTIMHARIVCHQGRVPDALALYENIAKNLTETRVIPGWEK